MGRYAKAQQTSEDGKTTVKARFDIEKFTWQVTIVGPVTNAANRDFLERAWEQTLQTTTDQLRALSRPSPADGAPWAFYFAETCRTTGLAVADALPPGKAPAEPLEY